MSFKLSTAVFNYFSKAITRLGVHRAWQRLHPYRSSILPVALLIIFVATMGIGLIIRDVASRERGEAITYPTTCTGEWENTEQVINHELDAAATADLFSDENSAAPKIIQPLAANIPAAKTKWLSWHSIWSAIKNSFALISLSTSTTAAEDVTAPIDTNVTPLINTNNEEALIDTNDVAPPVTKPIDANNTPLIDTNDLPVNTNEPATPTQTSEEIIPIEETNQPPIPEETTPAETPQEVTPSIETETIQTQTAEEIVPSQEPAPTEQTAPETTTPIDTNEVLIDTKAPVGALVCSGFTPDTTSGFSSAEIGLSLAARPATPGTLIVEASGDKGATWSTVAAIPTGTAADNASNGGYWRYPAEIFSSWQSIIDGFIRVRPDPATSDSGVLLDSLWIETKTANPPPEKETVEPVLKAEDDDNVFAADEEPTFTFEANTIPESFFTKIFSYLPFTAKTAKAKSGLKSKAIREWKEASFSLEVGLLRNNQPTDITPNIRKNGKGKFTFSVEARNFRPGRYTLEAALSKDGETKIETYDFNWGVLVVNTDQSVYKTGDEAKLMFGVLDENGNTICDAHIDAQIIDPNGQQTKLSTDDETIKPSGACRGNNVTDAADYAAVYQTTSAGVYRLTIAADNGNGLKTISDSFQVVDTLLYRVRRQGASRIYPPAKYKMNIEITTIDEFTGMVSEFVPSDFVITPSGEFNVIDYLTDKSVPKDTKRLDWQITMTANETKTISYEYDAPDISPELFKLGKLTINKLTNSLELVSNTKTETVFTEYRYWLIASDSAETETRSFGTEAAVTTSAGDNNGYETTPTNANADGGGVATDTNSGTANNDACPDTGGTDQHQWSNFGFTLPTGVTIDGITLRQDVAVDDWTAAGPSIGAWLSYDGGTTSVKTVSLTQNAELTYNLGGATDNWGRIWTASEIRSSNFLVQTCNMDTNNSASNRDFSLDYLAVTVNYTQVNISVGGTVYTDEGTTTMGSGRTVRIYVDGGSTYSTTTAANGTYSIANVAAVSGSVITVYLDGATENATTVTLSGGANITDLHLYQDRVILRSDSGSSITNINLDNWDSDNEADGVDGDLGFQVSGTTLTVSNTRELHVWTGDTFAPGSGTTVTLNSGGSNPGGDLHVIGTFNPKILNVYGGDITGSGTITQTSTTTTVRAAGTVGGGSYTFNNLTLGDGATAVTTTLGGAIIVSAGLTVNASHTLNTSGTGYAITALWASNAGIITANGSTITFSGVTAGNVFTNTGTFTAGSSTVKFQITNSINPTSGTIAFYNLEFSPTLGSGYGYTLVTGMSVSNNFDIKPAAASALALTVNMGADLTVTGTTTIAPTGSATATLDVRPSSTDYNLTTSQLNINTGGTLDAASSASVIKLTGSGTSVFNMNGADRFTEGSSRVWYNGTSDTTISATSNYYYLEIYPTSATSATYTLGGNLTVNGTGTQAFNAKGTCCQTITVDTSNYSITVGSGGLWLGACGFGSIANLSANSSTIQIGSTSTAGDLTVSQGTLSGSPNITVYGTIFGGNACGTINVSGGTITQSVISASNTFGTEGGTQDWTLNNLTFTTDNASLADRTITTRSGGTGKIIVAGTLTVGGAGTYSTTLDNETNDRIIDANGDVTITAKGSLTASSTASFTVAGNWANSGTFTKGTGTVTFDAGDSGNTINTGGTGTGYDFNNVIFNNAAGSWTFQTNAATITNDLTVTNTSATGINASVAVTVNGNVSCGATCGTINITNAVTFTQSVGGSAKNFGTNVAVSTVWTFSSLTFTASSVTITTSSTGTGNIVVTGVLTISASTTLDAGNRTWVLQGATTPISRSGTFTKGTSTVQYSSTSGAAALASAAMTGSNAFYNLTIDGTGTFTTGVNTEATNNLTMTAGTLGGTSNITVNGNATGTAGVINLTGGTFKQEVGSAKNFGPTTANTDWTFSTLTLASSSAGGVTITAQSCSTCDVTVSGIFYLGESGDPGATTLDAGDKTWTLSGAGGDPFQILASPAGNLTPNTSTYAYTGNNGAGNTTLQVETYNNLTLGGGVAENYDAEGTMNVANDLTINANGTLIGTDDWTVNGHVACGASCGTITLTGGTFLQSVGGSAKNFGTNVAVSTVWTFSSLTFTASSVTITTSSTGTGNIAVTGVLTISASTTLDAGNRTWVLSGSTTPISRSGTFTSGTSTVSYTSGSGTTALASAAMTGTNAFYNLTINGTGNFYGVSAVEAANQFKILGGAFDASLSSVTVGSTGVTDSGQLIVASGQSFAALSTTIKSSASSTASCIGGITLPGCTGTVGTLNPGWLTIGDGATTMTTAFGGTTPSMTIDGILNITANATFGAGTNSTITLSGSGTPITKTGTFTKETSTISYTSSTGVDALSSAAMTGTNAFYNLEISAASQTFNAGINAEVSNVLTIAANTTFDAGATTITLAGSGTPLIRSGTFTKGTSTVVYTSGSGTTALASAAMTGSNAFYNLTINGTGTFTAGVDITAANDLAMTAGTLGGTNNVTVNGNATGTAGVINLTGGTFEQRVTAAKNFGPTTASTNWTFATLTFSNSNGGATPITITAQSCATCGVTVSSVLNIGKTGDAVGATTTLDAGNKTWTLSGSGTPLVILGSPAGAFTASTSTIVYTGSSATNVTAATYNNLNLGGSSTTVTYTAAGDFTVGSVLTIVSSSGTNTFDASSRTITLSGSGTPFVVSATEVFTASASTINYTGTSATNVVGGITYNNLTVGTTGTGTTYTLGAGTTIVSAVLTITAAGTGTNTLDISNDTLTLSGSGTPLVLNSQTFTTTGSTVNYTGSSPTITATTYNTLNLSSSGTATLASGTIGTGDFNITTGAVTAATNNPTINIGGSLALSLGITYTKGSGTTTFSGTTKTISDNTASKQDLGAVTINGTLTANTNVIVTSLTINNTKSLDISNITLTLTGSGTALTVNGTLTTTGSTVNYTGTSATNVVGGITYNNLTVGTTGTGTTYTLGAGTTIVSAVLTITAAGTGTNTLDISNDTLTLSGSGTPLVLNSQTFTTTGSTVNYTGTSATNVVGGITYNNLTAGTTGTGTTYTLGAGTTIVSGVLTVTAAGTGTNTLDISNDTLTLSGSGTPLVLNSQTFTTTGSTVNYTGSSPTVAAATYNNLTFNGSGTASANGNLNIGSVFTIQAGTFDATTRTITLSGAGTPFVVTGAFTPSSSTVIYAGASPTVAATTFNNLTLNGSGTYTLGGNMGANDTLTITAGTLPVGANQVSGGTITINGGALTMNTSNGQLKVGAGGLSMSSGSSSITTADVATAPILTTTGVEGTNFFPVSFTGGTLNVAEWDIRSVASTGIVIGSAVTITNLNKLTLSNTFQTTGGTDVMVDVTSQTVELNNWVFPVVNGAREINVRANTSGTLTMVGYSGAFSGEQYDSDNGGTVFWGANISGTLYSDEGTTPLTGSSKTIVMKVNGADACSGPCTAATSAVDGSFAIGQIQLAANDVVTVWIDGATEKAAAITHAASATDDITGLNLYLNRVILRSENANPITINDLNQYDAGNDTDLQFTATLGSPNTLAVNAGHEFHVWSGDTFTPGGNVTANGDVHIVGTFTATTTESHSVGASWTDTGTFNPANSTVTFTATSGTKTITSTGSSFYNLIINGSGGEFQPQDAFVVTNDLTITAGTLSGTQNITVNGNVGGTAGVLNLTGGTFEQRVAAAKNFGPTTASTNWTFATLTFSNSNGGATPVTITAESCSSCRVTVSALLNIGKTGDAAGATTTLDAANKTWTLSGSGTPLVIFGSPAGALTASTSTFAYTGSSPTVTAASYNNLTFNGSGTASANGNLNIGSVFTIEAGTFDATTRTITLSGSGTPFVASGTFTPSTSTVVYTNGTSANVAATSYYNLQTNGAGNYIIQGTTTIGNDLTVSQGTLSLNSQNLAVNGGDITSAGTIVCGNGNNTCSAGTVTLDSTGNLGGGTYTFYNLTLGDGTGATTTTAAGDFAANGTITIAASQTLDTSSRTITLNGTSTPLVVNGTFTAATGTIAYTSASGANIAAGTYNNLTVGTAATSATYTLAADTTVNGTLTASDTAGNSNTLNLNGKTLTLAGTGTPLILNGEGFTVTNSTVKYTGALDTTVAAATYNNLEINRNGTTFTLGGTTTVSGNLTITAGTLDADNTNNYGISVGGSWTNSGTFTARQGTVTFTSAGSKTITSNGSPFYNLTLNGTGADWTIQDTAAITNDLTVTAGELKLNNQNLTVGGGDITNSGTISCTSCSAGTVTLSGAGTLGGAGTTTLYNLTISGAGQTTTLAGAVTAQNDVTINAGHTLSSNSQNLAVGGNLAVTGDITCSLCSAGTLTLSGTGKALSGAGNVTLYNLNVAGSASLTNTGAKTVQNNVTIGSGATLTGSNGIFNIGGSWANSGTYTHNGGTVVFTATTTGKTITGNNSAFSNVTFNGAGGGWTYNDGQVSGNTTVQNGAVQYVNVAPGTVAITGGSLNVDWYLTVRAVSKNQTNTVIDTGDADITVAEASEPAVSTIFKYTSGSWGTAATTATTGSDSTGNTPLTNSSGALRIREYSRTSAATTYYRYNVTVSAQSGFQAYDYFADYGGNYLTSTSNSGSGLDSIIGTSWRRADLTAHPSLAEVNEPPSSGNWHLGLTPPPSAPAPSGGGGFFFGTAIAVPSPPDALRGQALSTDTIRWLFIDTAVNETGFQVRDHLDRIVAATPPWVTSNIDHLDEIGLYTNTRYENRRLYAFNASGVSASSRVLPSTYTGIESPVKLAATDTTATTVTLKISSSAPDGSFSNLATGESGLKIDNLTTGETSGWVKNQTIFISGLNPDTSYSFRAYSRNGDAVVALETSELAIRTLPAAALTTPKIKAPVIISPRNNEELMSGTFTLKGTADAFALITLTAKGVSTTAVADANGLFTFEFKDLPSGSYIITLRSSDASGAQSESIKHIFSVIGPPAAPKPAEPPTVTPIIPAELPSSVPAPAPSTVSLETAPVGPTEQLNIAQNISALAFTFSKLPQQLTELTNTIVKKTNTTIQQGVAQIRNTPRLISMNIAYEARMAREQIPELPNIVARPDRLIAGLATLPTINWRAPLDFFAETVRIAIRNSQESAGNTARTIARTGQGFNNLTLATKMSAQEKVTGLARESKNLTIRQLARLTKSNEPIKPLVKTDELAKPSTAKQVLALIADVGTNIGEGFQNFVSQPAPPRESLTKVTVPAAAPRPTNLPQELPPDTIIAKSPYGDITLSSDGNLQLLAGMTVRAYIKPSAKVETVTARLLMEQPVETDTVPNPNFFFNIPAAGAAEIQSETVERRIKRYEVASFSYEPLGKDKQPVWSTLVSMPPIAGTYILQTIITVKDGKESILETRVLTDPEGYIYSETERSQEERVKDAIVSLYYERAQDSFTLWPAGQYDQINPQVTDKTGQYSFFVPAGTYELRVEREGYESYSSTPFTVNDGTPVHQNIVLKEIRTGFIERLFEKQRP